MTAFKPAYFVDVPDSIADGPGLNLAVNGRLNPALLVQARGGGYGHVRAVPHFEAMKTAFDVDPAFAGRGYQLSYTGIYRTYDRQVQMLLERYTTTRIATLDTNYWQGKTWYLKPGYAQAATPGTSNHGWGLAWDFAIRLETGGLIALPTSAVAWLRAHSGWYGFYNEVASENWHYTYTWGDLVPPYLRGQPPVPPPPTPTPQGADVALWARFEGSQTNPVDIAFSATGYRRLSPARVQEMLYIGELRPGTVSGTTRLPAILPAPWEQQYPELGPPVQ